MAKGPGTDKDIRDAIHDLALDGYNIAETRRRIVARFGDAAAPSDVTVGKYWREVTPRDRSGEWRLAESPGRDAAPVLAVLAAVLERTEGRVRHLSVAESEWIVRLTTAVPDLPPWDAYRLARLYLARLAADEPSDSLDAALAFAPWRDRGQRYVAAFLHGWIDHLHWMEFSPEVEQMFLAAVEARERASKEPDR